MLGLFGRKSDHPMADPKSAQKLLDDLPKGDALKVVQDLASWIESVREQADFRPEQQLAALRMLDETARPYERRLMRDYFAAAAPSQFQENRLWLALNEFYAQSARAYLDLLQRSRNGAAALQPDLPLISARGISAVKGKLKCVAARYMPVEPAVWGQLAELYSAAEAQQYLDRPLALYPGLEANTSVRLEFASVLAWYACCAGKLNRLDGHLAERLAAHLRASFSVASQCGQDSLFVFDLHRPAAPMRMAADTAPRPGLLFIGASDAPARIEALLGALEKNVVPEEINLGGVYQADAVREVLRDLAACWKFPSPARRAVRHRIRVGMKVANGFAGVVEMAGADLNFGNGDSLIWETDDISSGGFHAVLPPQRIAGVEIGLLLGIQPENVAHWGVGIVRRLSRDGQNRLHVGVEILASRVRGAWLRQPNDAGEQPALWLDEDNSGETRLLLPPHTYAEGRSLQLRLGEKHFLLLPLALLETGGDYDLARYRTIEQDASGAEEAY